MKKYKCIVDIRIGWTIEVEAETEREAKAIAEELGWDNMFYSRNSNVSTNEVDCFDATEIKKPE